MDRGDTCHVDLAPPKAVTPRAILNACSGPTLPVKTQNAGAVPSLSVAVIAAYRQLIERALERGALIFGATILPYKGAIPGSSYYTSPGDSVRQAINAFIRQPGNFDGVIDFDAVTRDPANPLQLLAAYDSGDHLHPNDAGYQAMANAVDLQLFRIGRDY